MKTARLNCNRMDDMMIPSYLRIEIIRIEIIDNICVAMCVK